MKKTLLVIASGLALTSASVWAAGTVVHKHKSTSTHVAHVPTHVTPPTHTAPPAPHAGVTPPAGITPPPHTGMAPPTATTP